ncbi:hypothetical protein PUN28_015731 [Cardiocondyla obscurior]|uniref:Uncharacterized protein n=1 Tax=Cardiocondyla obscurior TaxID=286306 RepID=A0AAW2EZQ7_9HYME
MVLGPSTSSSSTFFSPSLNSTQLDFASSFHSTLADSDTRTCRGLSTFVFGASFSIGGLGLARLRRLWTVRRRKLELVTRGFWRRRGRVRFFDLLEFAHYRGHRLRDRFRDDTHDSLRGATRTRAAVDERLGLQRRLLSQFLLRLERVVDGLEGGDFRGDLALGLELPRGALEDPHRGLD